MRYIGITRDQYSILKKEGKIDLLIDNEILTFEPVENGQTFYDGDEKSVVVAEAVGCPTTSAYTLEFYLTRG